MPLLLKILFPLIGLGLLGGAFYTWHSTNEFVSGARVAQGTVVDLVSSRSSDSTWAPVVVFRTAEGREVRFRSEVRSSPPSHSVGETVEVLYRPEQPAKAEINSFMSLWFVTMVLGGIGAVFTLLGGALLFVREDQAQEKTAK